MFREMRRVAQQLPREETIALLERGTSGVLALLGDGGYPYAVPMSYVYVGNRILFHSALSGHKVDAVRACPRASFCVIGQDRVAPEAYTTHFKSAVVFGSVRVLEDEGEKRRAIERLAEKYNPGDEGGRLREIEESFRRLCVIELTIEHMTGKEAIELTRAREA